VKVDTEKQQRTDISWAV